MKSLIVTALFTLALGACGTQPTSNLTDNFESDLIGASPSYFYISSYASEGGMGTTVEAMHAVEPGFRRYSVGSKIVFSNRKLDIKAQFSEVLFKKRLGKISASRLVFTNPMTNQEQSVELQNDNRGVGSIMSTSYADSMVRGEFFIPANVAGTVKFHYVLKTTEGAREYKSPENVVQVVNGDVVMHSVRFADDMTVRHGKTLSAGEVVRVRYNSKRLTTPGTGTDVIGYVKIDNGSAMRFDVSSSFREQLDVPFVFQIPANAKKVSMWFQTSGGGDEKWDSLDGKNYEFEVRTR